MSALLRKQHGVVSREQALSCGIGRPTLDYRSRSGGPWQLLLPGVYLSHTGTATGDQREMGALLYAGPRSILTGAAALRRFDLPALPGEYVDVLVPVDTQRRDTGFARLHRTRRLPEFFAVAGEIRYVLPPRAVADTARGSADVTDVRAVVAAAVQRRRCPIERLAEELEAGPRRRSAGLRRALAEVADGVRSIAEGQLRDLIKRAGLPLPMFNARLFVGREFLASPDCWWPDAGVAAEVDSREWHLSPRDWEQTLARHSRMGTHGVVVLPFTPGQVRAKNGEVAATIRDALGAGRPLPGIRALAAGR